MFASKVKGLSEESFKTPVTSGNSFAPKLTFIYNQRTGKKCKENCLTQDNISFNHRDRVNLFIVYELIHGQEI